MKILKSVIVILFLFQSTGQVMAFDLKGKLDSLTGGGDSSEAFDLKGGKTQLMEAFYESSDNYKKALVHLLKAYNLNVAAAKVEATIEKNINASEADRMENSIKATTEASQAIEKHMKAKGNMVSAEGKIEFAKALPPAGKGLVGTIKLAPISSQMVGQVSANPLSAVKEIGGVAKIIPKLPEYMKRIQEVTKYIISGAKANDIKGAGDLEAKLGDLS